MADIDELLEKARKNASGYGEKYGLKETADDYLKLTYAQLYGRVREGSVAERDSWVKSQPAYVEAIERKRNAYADWKTAETFMKLLLAEAEVWRTKQATDRMMDKAHR